MQELTCACGHPETDHERVDVSTPIGAPPTMEELAASPRWHNIYYRYENSTYNIDACWCGCTIIEPNTDEDDVA